MWFVPPASCIWLPSLTVHRLASETPPSDQDGGGVFDFSAALFSLQHSVLSSKAASRSQTHGSVSDASPGYLRAPQETTACVVSPKSKPVCRKPVWDSSQMSRDTLRAQQTVQAGTKAGSWSWQQPTTAKGKISGGNFKWKRKAWHFFYYPKQAIKTLNVKSEAL